jgi:hypothetical protein
MPKPSDEEFAKAKARAVDALSREYPWADHDHWSSDEECQEMIEAGENPWPHLEHVVQVAVWAAMNTCADEFCQRQAVSILMGPLKPARHQCQHYHWFTVDELFPKVS